MTELTKHGTVILALRRPRKWKASVHWIDVNGEVACGTPITTDQATTHLTREIAKVTCTVCCKQIELQQQKDFFGNPKVAEPKQVDWVPLFS